MISRCIASIGHPLTHDRKQSEGGMLLGPSSQASQQQANHRYLDEGFARLHVALIVHDQPSVTKQPSKGSFEDPAITPIGRFGSVMRALLSSRRFQCMPLSSAGDVQRQGRGVDRPASAPARLHRPTQSTGATQRAPGAPAPHPARSS